MALIKCPECGTEVSDKATTCIKCGCPINTSANSKPGIDVEKMLNLALDGIKAKNAEQVEKYCQKVLEADPTNSKAWEYEARGLLFNDTLKDNKVSQAINAAANAINYSNGNKKELAVSLYHSICPNITALLNIALSMPMVGGIVFPYIQMCFKYYGELLKLPELPKELIKSELASLQSLDDDSKKAFMPKKRYIYASHAGKPSWAEQFKAELIRMGRL